MLYSLVAEAYERMESTTKRLELTDILVDLLKQTPRNIVDRVVYLTQGKLYPDFMGVEIGLAEKLVTRAISLSSGTDQSIVEEIYHREGDIGSAAERLLKDKTQATFFAEPLTVERVYDTLDKIAHTIGQGSVEAKLRSLSSLLNDAAPKEAKYIVRVVTGELRLGIADYTVLDALAIAYTGDKANRTTFERAYNISSDLGAVARAAANEGLEGIRRFNIKLGFPIRPMLAERLETANEIIEKLGGKCASEYKLDGERLQVHKDDGSVQLFSRRLENITSHYPDAVELVKMNIDAEMVIAEAEAVAINIETGEFLPFQQLMHRRRKYGIEEAMQQFPISLSFFDLLYLDGEDMTLKTYLERRKALEKIVVEGERIRVVPSTVTSDPKKIEGFMEQAITDGCEGLVVKDLKSFYRAGAREFAWIKLKRSYKSELADTLDITIVGAFHGRGRRAGVYGAFLCAVYDKEAGIHRTCCKVGTGFTDQDLKNFAEMLKPSILPHRHPRVDSRMEADAWFKPKHVIQVIADEVTLSPIHSAAEGTIRSGSGLSLRFPKYTGVLRTDKGPEDATTVEELVSFYKKQLKHIEESIEAKG